MALVQDRYQLDTRLGAGATGEVWRATDTRLGRTVALKFLQAVDDQVHRDLFTAEAHMLARLHHPGITVLFDAVLPDGGAARPCLVMEFVDGVTLSQHLLTGLSLGTCLDIALHILDAIGYAHTQGIIHRDIKPDNVLIKADGSLKLTDFGFANLVSILRGGSAYQLGTDAYIPPEQVKGDATDERSDLYSFGVLLFELLTAGRLPFEDEDPEALMMAHLTQPPPPVRTFVPDVPILLDHIIARLLEKDPEQRYPAADALRYVLEPLRARHRFQATHTSLVAPTDKPLVGRTADLATLRTTWQTVQQTRQPRLLVLTGPAGIGKSRLVAEVLGEVAGQGAVVLVGRGGPTPYSPLADILDSLNRQSPALLQDPLPNFFSRLIPGLATRLGLDPARTSTAPASPTVAAQTQIELFETLLGLMARLGPVALLLEDAAILDEASLALVSYLLRRGRVPLLILAAARDDEARLRWPDDLEGAVTVPLPPLTAVQAAAMLETVLGGPVDEAAAQAVYRRSHGNPYFIEEVARHLRDGGDLSRDDDGTWHYRRRRGTSDLPPTLRSLFQRRLARLSDTVRHALGVAAVIGTEFAFEVWAALLEADGEALALRSLDEALGYKLLLPVAIAGSGEDRYRFNPPTLAGSLSETIPGPRRRRLHSQIAAILATHRQTDPAHLAAHYQAANQPSQAARSLEQAGATAATANAIRQATGYYRQAVRLDPSLAGYEALGQLLLQQGDATGARTALTAGLDRTTTGAARARVLNHLSFASWLYDHYQDAYRYAADVLTLDGVSDQARAEAHSHLGMVAWLVGRFAEAERLCQRAVTGLQHSGDTGAMAGACNRLGLVYLAQGRAEAARHLFQQALNGRRQQGDVWGQAFALVNLAQAALVTPETTATAATLLTAAGRLFDRIESRDGQMVVWTNWGRYYLTKNDLDAASLALARAMHLAMEIGKWSSYGLGDIYLLQVEVALASGDLDRAGAALTEGLRLVEAAGNRAYVAVGYALLTQLHARRGDPAAAQQAYTQALHLAQAMGDYHIERIKHYAGF